MIQKIPAKSKINQYLLEANRQNPGLWYQHSLYTAEAAKLIAERCPDLNPELAYAMGALHDIGRREGYSHLHHTISGYNFMIGEGYKNIARICLTHSFPIKEISSYFGRKDCSNEELTFISEYLKSIEYDEYDKLVQLCDSVSSAEGYCHIEKRLINVMARYGTNDFAQDKTASFLSLKDYFSDKIGKSIYRILPNVIENTIGFECDAKA